MGFLDSLFGGPSKQEEQQQAQMAQTSKDLAYDTGVAFANDQAMYKSTLSAISPTLAKGPEAFGMSTAEEASERTLLAEQLASAEGAESNMVNEALASRGITAGSGVSPAALASIEGALAQKYAVAGAEGNVGITEQGYEIGRQNFWNSVNTALGLQKTEAGLSAEQAKTGVEAGKESFSEAQTINSQKNGLMKGLLAVGGDIAGSFLGDPNLGNQFVSAAYGTPQPAGTQGLGSGIQSMFNNNSNGPNPISMGLEGPAPATIPGDNTGTNALASVMPIPQPPQ